MSKKIKLFSFIILLILCIGLTACKNPHKDEKVSIKDIEWEVKTAIVNKEKYAVINFTNNSEYTIYEFEIDLRPKKSFKGSKLEEFYEYFQDEYDMDDADMISIKEDGVLRIECDYSAQWSDNKPIKSGETLSNERICYYGYLYIKNLDWYDYFEPYITTLVYEDEGYVYTVYYDYEENEYTHDSDVEALDDYLY